MKSSAGCLALFVATSVLAGAMRADEPVLTQLPEVAPSVTVDPATGKPADPAGGGPETLREAFHLLPGFRVERLFTVPRKTCGSWVSLTVDPKGRLIASDQAAAGLFRITPSPIGSGQPTRVEPLLAGISSAQGLLFAFGSLYVTRNGHGALYRLRDTDGDDRFDETTRLAEIAGGGEHGPHGLRLSPDGKQILLVAGNHTQVPLTIVADPPQRMGGVRTRTAARHDHRRRHLPAVAELGRRFAFAPAMGCRRPRRRFAGPRRLDRQPSIPTESSGTCGRSAFAMPSTSR